MTKSARLIALSFLVMLAGAILLYSLATALPAGANGTINPLVQMFYQPENCISSTQNFSCSGLTGEEAQAQLMSIIQMEELVAFGLVLIGLILGIIGYQWRDAPAHPTQPPQSVMPGQSTPPLSHSSTP